MWAIALCGIVLRFVLPVPEILATVEALREAGLLEELRLLHFHVGSQINDIGVVKDALQEASRIYVELHKLGAPMGYLDVGGGLGIDYDGSRTATAASTNYSLQNYANDVVATVKEGCEPHDVAVPTLVSESGRAIASHFSVLVFNVLGSGGLQQPAPPFDQDEPLIVRNLRETFQGIEALPIDTPADPSRLQEAWNDALKFKEDALAAFRLGYLSLKERSMAAEGSIGNQLAPEPLLTGIKSMHKRDKMGTCKYFLDSIRGLSATGRAKQLPNLRALFSYTHKLRAHNDATALL